jgi:ornithine cyclodeaminase/alanine dehydrogenase-like protein (mu-crystallin family)
VAPTGALRVVVPHGQRAGLTAAAGAHMIVSMLVISRAEVRELLDLDALIDALAPAMADLSAGRASVPPRVAAMVSEREGFLAAMPGYVPSAQALVSKLVTLFPRNSGTPVAMHQAVIAAFDPKTGSPVALLDGTEITAARTGACSALSARLLAREDASVLAVLGTGVQARSHARAVVRVRPIREIRVAGRDPAKAQALAAELARELGLPAHAAASYEDASLHADIVCATTHAVQPVARRAWLSPGVHVTSVGYNSAGREVDDQTVADALVCVESRSAVLADVPAGSTDLIQPMRDGLIGEDHIHAELGELVLGTRPGRTSPDQITLYKSVGVAVQDAAAAALVLDAAQLRGVGRELEL